MLIGGVGSGKTSSIKTFLGTGITPCALFTEFSFDVLGDTKPEELHWRYIKPITSNMQNLRDAAKKIGQQNADMIQKGHDMTRSGNNQFEPMLEAIANFKCQRTGLSLGDVTTWGTDKAFILDGLSGLTTAATKLAVGEKYAMTQPEFQIAMKLIENTIMQLCNGFHCHVVVMAHPEREVDEVNGGVKIYPSTLGKKVAPTLGRHFTDVLMAKRQDNKFYWDGVDPQADLKVRNFPRIADMPPSFVQGVEAWKKRGGIISPELPPLETKT